MILLIDTLGKPTRPAPERPTPLLVVDLDGTVRHGRTELGRFVNTPEDVIVFPEAVDRMRQWKNKGGRVIAVSNQGGIALGHTTLEQCRAAMMRTHELCGEIFDKICFCPHFPTAVDPEMARCWCRKPSPGLLIEGALEIAARYGEYYPPHLGLFVGDRLEDEECARLAGFPFQWAHEWRAARAVDADGSGRVMEHVPPVLPEREAIPGEALPDLPDGCYPPGAVPLDPVTPDDAPGDV